MVHCPNQAGMKKVSCSDPNAIFQDTCGQCWANITTPPPSCPDQQGMDKVSCSHPNAIYQDVCGQCWANKVAPPPPPVCDDQVGMRKVDCNDSDSVFQDECGQCWADIQPPPPVCEDKVGMVKVSCSDPSSIVKDNCGQCWADILPPPPPECEDQTGMIKVDCDDEKSIFIDLCGQCWAIMPDTTPPKSKKVLEIDIVPFFPNAIQRLNLDNMFSTIFNFLPVGWNIENIEVTNSKIKITFIEEGSPTILASIILIMGALIPLLIVVGIIVIGWKLFDFLTEAEETKQVVAKTEIAELIESNKDELIGVIDSLDISKEAKIDLITKILAGDVDSLLGGIPSGVDSNTLIIIALIGVGGLIAFGLTRK